MQMCREAVQNTVVRKLGKLSRQVSAKIKDRSGTERKQTGRVGIRRLQDNLARSRGQAQVCTGTEHR